MTPVARRLIDWYTANRIEYPWRQTRDPYRIWLSEILLQQTRIPVVLQYYEKILRRFPSLAELASAPRDEFVALWSGIGYYSRARNMHACARRLTVEFGGRFPSDFSLLRSLPGIGPYTAAALRNLCFGLLTPALDGNVKRVLARLTANHAPSEGRDFQRRIEEDFAALGADAPAGDYFEALMELGERICLPQPRCLDCPLRRYCAAYRERSQDKFPVRRARPRAKVFHWYFLLVREKNRWLLAQNPSRGFLKDAWLFPDILSQRTLAPPEIRRRFASIWKLPVRSFRVLPTAIHSVTFRRITCHALLAARGKIDNAPGKWMTAQDIASHQTSSVVGKILNLL